MGLGDLFRKQLTSEQSQTPSEPKKKVLVVEDEIEISDIYQQILTERGFEVAVATNGQEGLAKIAQFSPGLILLDIRMPIMDGKTMLAHLRKDAQYAAYKNIPVVMLTNSGNTDNIRETQTLGGANEFRVKANIEPSEVADIAAKYLH